MAKGVSITNECFCAEGSYVSTVTVYGCAFAAHYIKGEVRLHGIGRKGQLGPGLGWKVKKYPAMAKAAIEARIKELGPEFAAAHTKLYSEEG